MSYLQNLRKKNSAFHIGKNRVYQVRKELLVRNRHLIQVKYSTSIPSKMIISGEIEVN